MQGKRRPGQANAQYQEVAIHMIPFENEALERAAAGLQKGEGQRAIQT